MEDRYYEEHVQLQRVRRQVLDDTMKEMMKEAIRKKLIDDIKMDRSLPPLLEFAVKMIGKQYFLDGHLS